MNMTVNDCFKTGYIAFAGRPNVGKSTLFNSLLNQKAAIVTHKPQTTRNRVLGILNSETCQIICLDTPGLIDPETLLQQSLVKTARSTMTEADLLYVIISADSGITPEDEQAFALARESGTPLICIINKTDLVTKQDLLPVIRDLHAMHGFETIIPVSALKKQGMDELLAASLDRLPAGPALYPPDIISDEPERFFVAEIIREQIFLQFGAEVPYATAVVISGFTERPGRKDVISASVIVERPSQKGIIIGKGGQAVKKLGQNARHEIEKFLGRPVFLDLHVQVRKGWRKDPARLKELGYS